MFVNGWVFGSDSILELVGVIVGAFITMAGVWELLSRKPQIIFDDRGVSGSRVGSQVVPWGCIRGAHSRPMGRVEHVWLEWVRPGTDIIERLPIRANVLEVSPQILVKHILRGAKMGSHSNEQAS